MCGSLCLVIRTVNDRDAWGDRERERERLGVEGVIAGDLSHTRALLQATIACVVIVLKAWRPGPGPPPVDWGPRLSLSELFSSFLWPVRCLCSQGEGQFEEK